MIELFSLFSAPCLFSFNFHLFFTRKGDLLHQSDKSDSQTCLKTYSDALSDSAYNLSYVTMLRTFQLSDILCSTESLLIINSNWTCLPICTANSRAGIHLRSTVKLPCVYLEALKYDQHKERCRLQGLGRYVTATIETMYLYLPTNISKEQKIEALGRGRSLTPVWVTTLSLVKPLKLSCVLRSIQ